MLLSGLLYRRILAKTCRKIQEPLAILCLLGSLQLVPEAFLMQIEGAWSSEASTQWCQYTTSHRRQRLAQHWRWSYLAAVCTEPSARPPLQVWAERWDVDCASEAEMTTDKYSSFLMTSRLFKGLQSCHRRLFSGIAFVWSGALMLNYRRDLRNQSILRGQDMRRLTRKIVSATILLVLFHMQELMTSLSLGMPTLLPSYCIHFLTWQAQFSLMPLLLPLLYSILSDSSQNHSDRSIIFTRMLTFL